ncbi:putative NADPH dehydrogenase [Candidatus Burkholderia pumila]|uniref:NADPH dehydrogenase n=1 Tax=Candidatus Burkholderia pumila TaxID=1090375 RepID=A0ABR5HMG3_9BURK|nr:putative NADPH dehydrogenase [Candidatus Burkholderia pumila]
MPYDTLLSPVTIGNLELPNRVVMVPLTRNRASQPGDVPTEMERALFIRETAQRARRGGCQRGDAGFAARPELLGYGPEFIPIRRKTAGRTLPAQCTRSRDAWRCSFGTSGACRIGWYRRTARPPVASSAIRAENTQVFVQKEDGSYGMVDADDPRPLETTEIPRCHPAIRLCRAPREACRFRHDRSARGERLSAASVHGDRRESSHGRLRRQHRNGCGSSSIFSKPCRA